MRFKLLFIFLYPFALKAQVFQQPKMGYSIGVSWQFGTVVNGIGWQCNAFFTDRFYQFNLGNQTMYQLTGLGQRKRFIQSRFSTGVVLLAGKRVNSSDFQLNGLLHNTRSNYALAYNYLWYFDRLGTSQRSGGWGLHLKKVSILFENDFFGGQGRDRFRTGHFTLSYRDSSFRYLVGFLLWTGETSGTDWQKTAFKDCPNGYRSLEDKPYGKTSHGILYAGLDYGFGHYQWLSYQVGIDSEVIRHHIQNRFMHDLNWLPKGFKRNTPHYPMLDANGCPVFNKREARKKVLFCQMGLNPNWSY